MPRVQLQEEPGGSLQVQRALYFRCRRGEPEALATLLYRLVDRLYTGASFVAPDEPSAVTALILTWEDLLGVLERRYVGGRLQDHALRLLTNRLLDYADRRTIRRKLRNAEHEPEDGLLSLPEEHLRTLLDMVPAYAEQIAANHRERLVIRRRTLYGVGVGAVLLVAGLLWVTRMAPTSASDLHLQCLQQRIERGGLIEVVQDCLTDLPDSSGANQLQARSLQHISLVLEEISNTRGPRPDSGLRYLVERVVQEGLAEDLAEIAQTYEGDMRSQLLKTQLLLEEVQNL
ncbi:MAG: hypothetical protein ACYC63_17695 [Armatimonadota bacterium]